MNNTTQDFIKRIDLTALTDVTGSEMNQLIDTAHPASNKGLIIETTDTAEDTPDVPNPDVEFEGITPTDWKRYIWVRKPFPGSPNKVWLYTWNENLVADTLLKWEKLVDVVSLQTSIENALEQAANAQTAADAASASAEAASDLATAAKETADEAKTLAETAGNTSSDNSAEIAALDDRVELLENPTSPLDIAKGGTGGASLSAALINLGLDKTIKVHYFIWERYSVGINAPNSTPNTYVKRLLNSIDGVNAQNISGACTLNGDSTIDLLPGRWLVHFSFPAGGVNGGFHQARLVKDADSSLLLEGTTEFVSNTVAATRSIVRGYILLTQATKVKFVHKTQNVLSFGVAGSLGDLEVYAEGLLQWLGNN